MRIINQIIYAVIAVTLFITVSAGCENLSGKQSATLMKYASFHDIPGVTEDEIKAIEALREKTDFFVFGMMLNTEAYLDKNGKINGYTALLCEWLSGLFGIPFKPQPYTWNDLLDGLNSGGIDFVGNLTTSDERRQIYFMTDAIAQRMVKYLRLKDSVPLSEIAKTRLPRYALLKGTTTVDKVFQYSMKTFEPVYIAEYKDAYRLLKTGVIDALVAEGTTEAVFDDYGDVVTSDFLPLLYSPVSLTAKKPELEPIISVVQKALESGVNAYLGELYNQGYQEYLSHKLLMQFSEEELSFIKANPVIPFAAEYDNYPVSFYSARANEWQGICFDVLKEVELLTGLTFKVVHDQNAEWSELLRMLESGEVYIITELIRIPEREGRFIWPETAFFSDQSALLSKAEFPNINIHDVLSVKVGLTKNLAHTELFRMWFPDHRNSIEYDSSGAALEALVRGEIDMVMNKNSLLLHLTHYQELPGYKANIVFDNNFESTFGLNKDQVVLCSIIDKALGLIDTKSISGQWLRKTYDYRLMVVQAQRPWLIGAIILSLVILALISAFFVRSRSTGKQLEKLVKQRTGELQQSTSELELQTSTLQTMVDSIPDIVYCKDLNLDFTLCNKFFADYLGCNKDDVVGKGKNPNGVLPAGLIEMTNDVDRRVINEGRMIIFEQYLPSFYKEERLFETIKAPLIIDGVVTGLVGIARDITDRKAMEEETKAASRSKSAFLANMSHEMRTPMNVIVGLTDLMLEEDDSGGNLKNNLEKISTAGNTLLGLINDVLDISKIEAGKLELIPVQYEMPSLLNDIIILNMIRIESKPIAFRLDINEELPYSLYGDDLRVKQIINNLLSNAFKYTQKGTVTLGMNCKRQGSEDVRMSVWVNDTGIGIREEDLKKLFTDYSQVSTQANRQIEGTGLGLSITKMLVERMDGKIFVESEYGKGSTFRFHIRQKFVSDKTISAEVVENLCNFRYAEDKRKAAKNLVRPDLNYASVLVVDDMPNNLDVAAALLGKYKMRVDCVTSGQEAINRINSGEPVYDAIFMDHMMPGMDGVEATAKIRAIGTKYAMTIPIIALTANAIVGNEQMFLDNDFQAFLAKPINVIQLDSIVRKWINR